MSWKVNTGMNLRDLGCEDRKWMDLIHYHFQ
jgi:hypothetical protein